jgi:hypothetical protein
MPYINTSTAASDTLMQSLYGYNQMLLCGDDCPDCCRVGNLLLMLAVVFTFSSGMPILYGLGLLSASLQTLLDRWLLTKQCQVPRTSDAQLPNLVLGELHLKCR